MLGFMKCVVEATADNGIQGLLDLVPGGPCVYKVGAEAIKRHREKNARNKLDDNAHYCRAACRYRRAPDYLSRDFGFRVFVSGL